MELSLHRFADISNIQGRYCRPTTSIDLFRLPALSRRADRANIRSDNQANPESSQEFFHNDSADYQLPWKLIQSTSYKPRNSQFAATPRIVNPQETSRKNQMEKLMTSSASDKASFKPTLQRPLWSDSNSRASEFNASRMNSPQI